MNHWSFPSNFREKCTTRGVFRMFFFEGGLKFLLSRGTWNPPETRWIHWFRGVPPMNTTMYNPFYLPRSSRRPLQHSWGPPSRRGRGCPPRSPCRWTCTPSRRRHSPPLKIITFSKKIKNDFIIFIVRQPDCGNICKYRVLGCKDIWYKKTEAPAFLQQSLSFLSINLCNPMS